MLGKTVTFCDRVEVASETSRHPPLPSSGYDADLTNIIIQHDVSPVRTILISAFFESVPSDALTERLLGGKMGEQQKKKARVEARDPEDQKGEKKGERSEEEEEGEEKEIVERKEQLVWIVRMYERVNGKIKVREHVRNIFDIPLDVYEAILMASADPQPPYPSRFFPKIHFASGYKPTGLELWVDKDILYFGLKEDEKSHIDGFVPVSWGTVQSHFNDFIDLSLSHYRRLEERRLAKGEEPKPESVSKRKYKDFEDLLEKFEEKLEKIERLVKARKATATTALEENVCLEVESATDPSNRRLASLDATVGTFPVSENGDDDGGLDETKKNGAQLPGSSSISAGLASTASSAMSTPRRNGVLASLAKRGPAVPTLKDA